MPGGGPALPSFRINADGTLAAAGLVTSGVSLNLTASGATVAYRPDGTLVRSFGTEGKIVSSALRHVLDRALVGYDRVVVFGDRVFPGIVLARYVTTPVVKVRTEPAAAVTIEVNVPPRRSAPRTGHRGLW